MSGDSQMRLARAREKLPLRTVIEQSGKAPQNGNWKKFPACPWCDSASAGVYTSKMSGRPAFKCHHVPCPTGNKDMDEIGFLAMDRGLSNEEAWKVYLKEAGEWVEERLPQSVLPGAPRRKAAVKLGDGEDEALIAECIAAVRSEQRASVSFLQRRLRLGYTRAARIMDILEERGVVGPSRGPELRDVLIQAEEETLTPAEPEAGDERLLTSSPTTNGPETATGEESLLPVAGAGVVQETERRSQTAATNVSPETPASSASPSGVPSLSPGKPAGLPYPSPTADNKALADGTGNGKDNPPPPSPPAPPAAPLPEGEPPSPAVAALRWFYERLKLTDSDGQTLWHKRGLTRSTQEALGYRSNLKSNREVLLEMPKHFPKMVLLDCGLWKYPAAKDGSGEDFGREPIPNAQYYGLSLIPKRDPQTGKKVRNEDGEPVIEPIWGDPECMFCKQEFCCPNHSGPVLIPYFDERGDLVHIRPHKGMMKDRTPRFYVARPCRGWLAARGLAGGTPADTGRMPVPPRAHAIGAVPGITMAKLLLPDIEEWLEGLTANLAVITEGEFKAGGLWQELDEPALGTLVRQVVVVYDNENKRDPNLPGYQEELWKQLEVEVWSQFMAGLLVKEGFDAMVGHLPDEWRDRRGKADWDGWLAVRLKELLGETFGDQMTTTMFQGYAAHHPLVRLEFAQVLKQAIPVRALWQAGLFESQELRIIHNRLERLNRDRLLPIGGSDEETIARRLRRLIPRLKRGETLPPSATGYLYALATKYEATKGGYYVLKPLTEKEQLKWKGYHASASASSDTDLKRVCELVLYAGPEKTGGLPERISDFYLKAHYCLLKTTGERVRLVSLHNIHGVDTKTIRLPSADFAQPAKFREWLLNMISGGTWRAGERELQKMQEDIGCDLARKEIGEVAVRGYHGDSKCWFYGDVVYTPDGGHVRADKDGIIWIKSKGEVTQAYVLAAQDQENENFCQGTPRMHPDTRISDEEMKDFWLETCTAFHETQGSYAAFLSMGAMLATFAGPEIYTAFNAAMCLWVHGQSREGKSCYVRWLMRFLGYPNLEKGMPLSDSTKAGISVALQQYGEGMIWLEEFQPSAPGWLIEKLKNVWDRGSGIKKNYDNIPRVIRSGVVVTGIATSNNAQLKSRYIHVQVAKKNRKRPMFDWFQEKSNRFHLFGRHALLNRKKFATRTMEILRGFVDDATITGMDERSRIVHGAAYAAFLAFNEIVGDVYGEPMKSAFRKFTIAHAQESERAVNERMNINEFWRNTLDGLSSDAFGENPADRREIFSVKEDKHSQTKLPELQVKWGGEHEQYRWKPLLLYFRPSELLDRLKKHNRQRGDDKPLEQEDLLAHMRVQPYWVPQPKGGHQMIFVKGSRRREFCWCIRVDDHEWGLQRKTDEEFEASLHVDDNPEALFLARDDWADPRKGDLFILIDSLESRKQGEKEEG